MYDSNDSKMTVAEMVDGLAKMGKETSDDKDKEVLFNAILLAKNYVQLVASVNKEIGK